MEVRVEETMTAIPVFCERSRCCGLAVSCENGKGLWVRA
jgi:hypothetical protein